MNNITQPTQPGQPGLMVINKSDGKKYTIRNDRRRYFFPNEWENFINTVTNKKHKFFFITLLFTGGRIMEALHIKYEDIDPEREIIILRITKQRKAKKDYSASGKTRSFFIASNFFKEYKSFLRGKSFKLTDYIFLNNSTIPANYSSLKNSEKKKYYQSTAVSYSKLLKRKLQKAGIEDYYNFSPHNIRKTYGMWMRTFNFEMGELCYRMGHDMDTYITHYGSSLIFTESERRNIVKILGDVK